MVGLARFIFLIVVKLFDCGCNALYFYVSRGNLSAFTWIKKNKLTCLFHVYLQRAFATLETYKLTVALLPIFVCRTLSSNCWFRAQVSKRAIDFYSKTEIHLGLVFWSVLLSFSNFLSPGAGWFYGKWRFAKSLDSGVELILSQHGTRLQKELGEM